MEKNNVFDDVESARMNEFAWGMADLNKLLQSKISLGDWIGDLSKRIFEPTTHWIMNIQWYKSKQIVTKFSFSVKSDDPSCNVQCGKTQQLYPNNVAIFKVC